MLLQYGSKRVVRIQHIKGSVSTPKNTSVCKVNLFCFNNKMFVGNYA